MIKKHASLAAAIAAVSVALVVPTIARAQRGSAGIVRGPVAAPAPARPAPSSGVRVNVSRNRSAVRGTAASTPRNRQDGLGFAGGFPLGLQDLLNLTPNNGFNWQFVNSINQDLGVKAFIDPVTQIEVAQAERLLRSTGGAFGGAYILGGGGYYYPPEAEENAQAGEQGPPAEGQTPQGAPPQVIVLQQAPAQQAAPQAQAEAPASEEIPDRGEFTLVLHSGKEIQAVAFTHAKDRIVYITPDGGRLTLPAADLDANATVRVNQERGTPLQLPL